MLRCKELYTKKPPAPKYRINASDPRINPPVLPRALLIVVHPNIHIRCVDLRWMGHEKIQINPPNLDDYSTEDDDSEENVDDDGTRPFTRDELKIRTLKGMQKTSPSRKKKVNI